MNFPSDRFKELEERIEKLESILQPRNHSAEEGNPCNGCKVEQWIKEDPEEWISYEFCAKRCIHGIPLKPKEDKPTIPAHEHIFKNGYGCIHCGLTFKEFEEKTTKEFSGGFLIVEEKPTDSETNVYVLHTIELKEEIERLNQYIANPKSYIEDSFKDFGKMKKELSDSKDIIKQALEYIREFETTERPLTIDVENDVYPFLTTLNEILEGKSNE